LRNKLHTLLCIHSSLRTAPSHPCTLTLHTASLLLPLFLVLALALFPFALFLSLLLWCHPHIPKTNKNPNYISYSQPVSDRQASQGKKQSSFNIRRFHPVATNPNALCRDPGIILQGALPAPSWLHSSSFPLCL
jgi:hypothetical protein